MKKMAMVIMVLGMVVSTSVYASDISGFDDLTLAAESYWNGSSLEGSYSATDSFKTDTASFNNFYAYDDVYSYSSWGGFAYANIMDTSASGFTAQYNAIPGHGESDSQNYAIGYCNTFAAGPPTITFDTPLTPSGAYFTNTNYAYYSMLNGDAFAKKFEVGDWFRLTITGKDINGVVTDTVEFLLAEDTNIVNSWTWVDLSGVGEVKTLEFSLASSDSGAWGMNTPAYFAMDTLNNNADFEDLDLGAEPYWNGSGLEGSYTATDEFASGIATYNNYFAYDAEWMYSSWGGFAYSNIADTAAVGWGSQYNAIAGGGHGGSSNYAIGYQDAWAGVSPTITFDAAQIIKAVRITNTNYAYYSMLNGDGFAKKFGGDTGNDEDWFLLTITGKDDGGGVTGTVEYYLADFRSADNADDYIIKDWAQVKLDSLGEVKRLEFGLSSSDGGQGIAMNTPAYFAVDSVNDFDDDGDGYSEVEGDCNDDNADINPDAVEICGDGIDQDCSGSDLSCEEDDDNWLEGCFINVTKGAMP